MKKVTLFYDEIETPIGHLVMLSNGNELIRIDFGKMADKEREIDSWVKRYIGPATYEQQGEKFDKVRRELEQYFNKERQEFTFPFTLYGTDFQKAVWTSLLQTVRYGETKHYGYIAESIGNPKAVRAIGGAVNKNPFSIVVPCHRIIGKSGKLVGYGGGLDKKKYLLHHEGCEM